MRSGLRWASFVLLAAGLGLMAFRMGWQVLELDESEMIDRTVKHYLRARAAAGDRLASSSDCQAVPGLTPDVWLQVSCASPGGTRVLYRIDHQGNPLDQGHGLGGGGT